MNVEYDNQELFGSNRFTRMFAMAAEEEPLRSLKATRPTIWLKIMNEAALAKSISDISAEYIAMLDQVEETIAERQSGRLRRARVAYVPKPYKEPTVKGVSYGLSPLGPKSSEADRFFSHPLCFQDGYEAKGLKVGTKDDLDHRAFAESRILRLLTGGGKKVALDSEMSVKVGLVQSNNPIVRASQAAVSIALPGDLSDIRKPVRSTIYETLTPGGLPNRRNLVRRALGGRGERNQLRCPPGFENGGRFARKDLSNCGLRIFDLPGFGLVPIGKIGKNRGKKPLAGEAIRGVSAMGETTIERAPGSVAPMEGTPTAPNVAAASDIDISRIALINTVGELNKQAREDAIEKAIPVAVKAKNPDFGRLVRRDGTMLDNVVPLIRLADVRNSDDMEEGVLVTAITDPMKFAVDEFQVMSAGLDGIVMATPDGKGFIRLDRNEGAGSIRGMRRRWGTLLRDQEEGMPGVAFDQLVSEAEKKLRLSIQYPGIQNPLEMVEIERGGAKRSVRKWVYVMFLSSEAPMRPKSTEAWILAEEAERKEKAKK